MNLKTAIFLFLLFISVSVGIFYLLYKKFYCSELLLRLYPLTEKFQLAATNSPFWMLGDSRVQQWNIPDTIFLSKTWCNLGVDGQTSAQVLYRLGLHLEEATPQYVFLQVGINDIKAIGVLPGQSEEIIGQCIENIELIIERCISHKIIPVFCTIFPSGDIQWVRQPFWSKDIKKAIVRVNSSLNIFCKLRGVAIFDSYSALTDNNGILIKKYQKDDLHLNAAGYHQLNERFNFFLKQENIINK